MQEWKTCRERELTRAFIVNGRNPGELVKLRWDRLLSCMLPGAFHLLSELSPGREGRKLEHRSVRRWLGELSRGAVVQEKRDSFEAGQVHRSGGRSLGI